MHNHVPTHGFTPAALVRGARDSGYPDVSIAIFGRRGAFELVRYHLVTQRLALASSPPAAAAAAAAKTTTAIQRGQSGTAVADNIRALCIQRLRANVPIIARWQEVRPLPIAQCTPSKSPRRHWQ